MLWTTRWSQVVFMCSGTRGQRSEVCLHTHRKPLSDRSSFSFIFFCCSLNFTPLSTCGAGSDTWLNAEAETQQRSGNSWEAQQRSSMRATLRSEFKETGNGSGVRVHRELQEVQQWTNTLKTDQCYWSLINIRQQWELLKNIFIDWKHCTQILCGLFRVICRFSRVFASLWVGLWCYFSQSSDILPTSIKTRILY